MKSRLIYIVSILILAGGLWAVLAAGRHLKAPFALAGEWKRVLPGGEGEAGTFAISQSGRFVKLLVPGREPIALQWQDEEAAGSGGKLLHLQGDRQSMRVHMPSDSASPGDVFKFELDGQIEAVWTAVRQPADGSAHARRAAQAR
jgi:hypothetical protein